ncbi:MAG: alpha/beta fold hydrolase [Prevotellaceae bacterium]|jgi:pimeloyl-ACP methyl ester carboxylesterase|nr:alpha/beta fold hydrolase [Prevotellaceae bacterium]
MYIHLYKWGLLLGLLLGQVAALFAQTDENFARAERAYGFFIAEQGDSIHAMLTAELQQKLSPQVFAGMMGQMERQVGKLQSRAEWKKDRAQGITIYYCDLTFERYRLRFLTSFDVDGGMNTIRLAPISEPSTAAPVVYDKQKMTEREITVGVPHFPLPGTLTLPLGQPPHPVVILVHGSGANDRDETLGPNKPFRDLAWELAKRGIATIRYEKRAKVYGAALPEGRELDYDTEAVDDVLTAIELAKQLPEIAPDSIYVAGHSLGAVVAPRIAERAPAGDLAGIILIAGTPRPLEELVVEQSVYLASLTDSSAATREQLATLKREAENTKLLGTPRFNDTIPLLLGQPRSYWLFINRYKPLEVARKLTLPILILQGERDYQVTMQDYGLWRFVLIRNKNVSFKSYPKLNHLLQEGTGKSTPFEYNHASPVPGYVTDDLTTFIRTLRLID